MSHPSTEETRLNEGELWLLVSVSCLGLGGFWLFFVSLVFFSPSSRRASSPSMMTWALRPHGVRTRGKKASGKTTVSPVEHHNHRWPETVEPTQKVWLCGARKHRSGNAPSRRGKTAVCNHIHCVPRNFFGGQLSRWGTREGWQGQHTVPAVSAAACISRSFSPIEDFKEVICPFILNFRLRGSQRTHCGMSRLSHLRKAFALEHANPIQKGQGGYSSIQEAALWQALCPTSGVVL